MPRPPAKKSPWGGFSTEEFLRSIGTHTHVQTADERIFPGGTAFLCDAGMCGPDNSCLGRDYQPIIKRFMDGLPGNFPVADGPVRICGAIIEVDELTGRALRISRVNQTVEE